MIFKGSNLSEDCELLLKELERLDFYRGTERRSGQFKGAKCKKGGGSMLYGTTWKGYLKYDENGEKVYRTKAPEKGLYLTKCRDLYPELNDIFIEFTKKYIPEFKWTQVQLNKNFQSPPHFDAANIGESYILGLGDYTKGRLFMEVESSFTDEPMIRKENIKNRLFCFNGSKYKHWTEDYEGNRYSVVFFNNNKMKKISET